jgi:hypothetical protein
VPAPERQRCAAGEGLGGEGGFSKWVIFLIINKFSHLNHF